jgi:hypothetical protein
MGVAVAAVFDLRKNLFSVKLAVRPAMFWLETFD